MSDAFLEGEGRERIPLEELGEARTQSLWEGGGPRGEGWASAASAPFLVSSLRKKQELEGYRSFADSLLKVIF